MTNMHCSTPRRRLVLTSVLGLIGLLHLVTYRPTEPFFYHDESRHVMTGVFFSDFLLDMPVTRARAYATEYYLQYPCLGLLIWPPLFHFVEGVAMLLFGPSTLVGQVLVAASGMLAGSYLFWLVERTHNVRTAGLSLLLFAVSPLVFTFSRRVMLEIPTLACGMAAIFYFLRYLDENRRKDVFLAAAASAAAALIRFDAVYLLPFFAISLIARRRIDVFRRAEVWWALALAILAVAPTYWVIAREIGDLHVRQAQESVVGEAAGFLAAANLLYYPLHIPRQVGWAITVGSAVGLILSLQSGRLRSLGPYLALLVATYCAFTPLAELEPRHAIYWVPALVVLAAVAAEHLATLARVRHAWLVLACLLVLPPLSWSLHRGVHAMRGYEQAGQHVLENTPAHGRILFDGSHAGLFVYAVRAQDLDRSHWVLLGNKLLYTFLVVPETDFQSYVSTNEEILDVIYEYDPAYIVVEEPLQTPELAVAARLRKLLQDHPERFKLELTTPVTQRRGVWFWNDEVVNQYDLLVYRNLYRNPEPKQQIEFDMLLLNRRIQSESPTTEK